MPVDIVDRLRNGISEGSSLRWAVTKEHLEAATEIATLRQQLAEARAHYEKNLSQIAALVELCEKHGLKAEALAAIRALAAGGEG